MSTNNKFKPKLFAVKKCNLTILLAGAITFSATASQQEQFFITPKLGYSFGASKFDVEKGADAGKLTINESNNYGFTAGLTTNDPGEMFILYSHQSTQLNGNGTLAPSKLTDLDLDYFHLGGTLYYPKANWEPYVSASLGLTQFRLANSSFNNETRFSMGIAFGTSYRLTNHLALQAELRGFATFMESNNDLFCDTNGCVYKIDATTFMQGQANIGVQYRF